MSATHLASSGPVDSLNNCPAPAKLNLFLHVLGREPNTAYHRLQTVFQLIDWHDTLHFTRRDDGHIERSNDVPDVPAQTDLCLRAAHLLRSAAGVRFGVSIRLDKRLPLGGGLGGGSSNAATTLLALNRLWNCGWPAARLRELALQLGADVPFFLLGRNAFAHGRGEKLQVLDLPTRYYVVIWPGISVSTAAVFNAPELKRDTAPIRIPDFIAQQTPGSRPSPDAPLRLFGHNDLQAATLAQSTRLSAVVEALEAQLAPTGHGLRMTGSGACFFVACASLQAAAKVEELCKSVIAQLPAVNPATLPNSLAPSVRIARGLARHPFNP